MKMAVDQGDEIFLICWSLDLSDVTRWPDDQIFDFLVDFSDDWTITTNELVQRSSTFSVVPRKSHP